MSPTTSFHSPSNTATESQIRLTPKLSGQSRFNLSHFALARPWLTIGFWLAVAMAGLMAFSSLKYALFPDITFPIVVINATVPLEDVYETEAQLTIPLEEGLDGLEHLESHKSTTYAGRSVVQLTFEVGKTLDASRRASNYALAGIDLPDQTEIEIIPFNLNESPAITYILQGGERNELYEQARQDILPVLRKLPGVLRVELLGAVDLEPLAQGTVDTALLGPTLVRFNGENALAVQVTKLASANTLDVVKEVRQAIDQLTQLNPRLDLELALNSASYIQQATISTIEALLLAVVLAVLIIFFFLWSWRSTLITAVIIPISLLGTCIVMAVFGFNLETITLLALALVIGIMVDDAIVAVENIIRHIELGESPQQAAFSASREISVTVAAAAFTIVAVFLPVGFMEGTTGQFFKPFGITVSAAVIISFLAALTLSPVLASFWLKSRRPHQQSAHQQSPHQQSVLTPQDSTTRQGNLQDDRSNGNGYHSQNAEIQPQPTSVERKGMVSRYRRLLVWALNHRGWVVLLAAGSFALGIALIPLVPQGFVPRLDRGEFNVVYEVSPAYLEATLREKFASSAPAFNPFAETETLAQIETETTSSDVASDVASEDGTAETREASAPDLGAFASFLEGLAPEQLEQLKVLQRDAAKPYVVREGEDLKTIAQRFLSSTDRWQVLARINRLDTPEDVQPGQMIMVLDLPLNEGAESAQPEPASSLEDQFAPLILTESREIARQLEAVIAENPYVASIYTILGERRDITRGRVYVKLAKDPDIHTTDVQDQLRDVLPQLDGISIKVEDISFAEIGADQPLKVNFWGDDLEQLINFVQSLKAKLADYPSFLDIAATGDEEVYSAQLADMEGTGMGDASELPSAQSSRNQTSNHQTGNNQTSNNQTSNKILHLEGRRVAYLYANLAPGKALNDATAEVLAIAQPIPEGIEVQLGGDAKRSAQVLNSFRNTLTLSIVCVLIVLLSLFRRLLDPLVILLALPLSVVGAVLGLLITRSEFGIISVIGMIFLVGLVNKHTIILVDYTNQLRQSLSRREALLTACPIRLRPVLMTTLSTILGMIPIAIGFGAAAEVRQPMAVAIIGGLLTSSVLSLIVVPVFYTLVDDVQQFLFRGLSRKLRLQSRQAR